jgi:hypothetical protein
MGHQAGRSEKKMLGHLQGYLPLDNMDRTLELPLYNVAEHTRSRVEVQAVPPGAD